MFCKNCGKSLNQRELFCSNCGKKNENVATNTFCTSSCNSLIQKSNEKILKKVNILRIFSSLGYLALLAYFIFFYITDVLLDASVAMAFIVGPIILAIITYLAIIVFLNLIYFNRNIVSNIRAVSIMEIIPDALFLLEQIPMLLMKQSTYLTNILMILGSLILLIFPILKLVLLKKVSNFNVEEKVKKNNRKYIISFIVLCFCLTGMVYFISLFTSSSSCNKHYDLDVEQINKEVKSYTYLGEEIFEDSPIGFECRSEYKETYISFKDKYNNDIKYSITDDSKGKISVNDAMSTIADVQFANNILKNEKISIVYDEAWNEYEFVVTDSMLAQYFETRVSITYKEPNNVHLYQFDLNDINYKVSVTLDQKYETSIDKTYIMPYIEMFVHGIYKNVGSEKIDNFELWLNDEPNLKISSYSSNKIIWNEKEY